MKKPPSNRQLKVGELIKRSLSNLFMRGDLPNLSNISVTVTEVRVSPDLRNATAYIYPLGGQNAEEITKILKPYDGFIRHYVTKDIQLKYSPEIIFRIDNSFDEAERIAKLLQKITN